MGRAAVVAGVLEQTVRQIVERDRGLIDVTPTAVSRKNFEKFFWRESARRKMLLRYTKMEEALYQNGGGAIPKWTSREPAEGQRAISEPIVSPGWKAIAVRLLFADHREPSVSADQ